MFALAVASVMQALLAEERRQRHREALMADAHGASVPVVGATHGGPGG
jgi:heme exporter protein D